MSLEQLGKNTTEGCVAPGLHTEVNASGGATRTLTADESGGMFLFDAATGVSYTLPTPVAGMQFTFYASVSVTSNAHAIATGDAAVFIGGTIQSVIENSATSEANTGDETASVTVSMNGSTTGGLKGTCITVTALSSTVWIASGMAVGSGTLATPFA